MKSISGLLVLFAALFVLNPAHAVENTQFPAARLSAMLAGGIEMPPLGIEYGANELDSSVNLSATIKEGDEENAFRNFANFEITRLVRQFDSGYNANLDNLQDLIARGATVVVQSGVAETGSIKEYLLSIIEKSRRADVEKLLNAPDTFLTMTLIRVYDTSAELFARELILIQGFKDRNLAIRIEYMQS